MDLQLELLPYHYYNTLGFDAELIDYIDHVDDSIVLEKIAPLYKGGGSPPIDPRVCFRMHYLYFTRPEISSFRELVRQLKDPKNHAWRNFIGVPNIKKVPAHSSLSTFRAKVSAELFYAILFDLIAQALNIKDFLLPMLSGIDSRPIFANVNGYKHKRCSCLEVDYLVADLGYFDAEDQKEALLKHDVAVVTEIKKNTVVPEHCSLEGRPECEQGHLLVFDGFDTGLYRKEACCKNRCYIFESKWNLRLRKNQIN